MKGLPKVAPLLLLTASMLVSCHKADTVRADSEPYSARDATAGREGLLRGIDLRARILVIAVENGMDQTFIWNERTNVSGMPSAHTNETMALLKDLANRPGSELSVKWQDVGSECFATSIDVRAIAKPTGTKSRRKLAVR